MNAVTVLSVTQDRRDRLVESQRNLQSKKTNKKTTSTETLAGWQGLNMSRISRGI